MPKLRVSYSAGSTWGECQQQYYYRYVQHLIPKVTPPALQLGTMLHDYLEWYYGGLVKPKQKVTLDFLTKLHTRALRKLDRVHGETAKNLAWAAEVAGEEETARTLKGLPEIAKNLAVAYHRVRGVDDIRRHRIVMVEKDFELRVKKGVILPGRIDMVTRTKAGYWLWETKTTGRVPKSGNPLRDLQVLIYRAALAELFDIQIVGVVWNYIHTKPPLQPRLLKNGTLSTAKGQTTTAGLAMDAIEENELDADDYQAFLRQVELRERKDMFPRHTLPIVAAESVLLRDYVSTVQDIQDAREAGFKGRHTPVRCLSLSCDWCSYNRLCQAVITGGNIDVLVKQLFTRESK